VFRYRVFTPVLVDAVRTRDETALRIKHHFSAEIDSTKQAYIERNFHPPFLFTDVRQLGDEDATTATTAHEQKRRFRVIWTSSWLALSAKTCHL
jgi:hypothetical protein